MIISSVDYSLTGPAICVFDVRNKFNFANCSFYYLTDTKKYATSFIGNVHGELFTPYDEECERYDTISDWVMRTIMGSERVCIEGYAYSATGRVFQLAENTGILKYKLYQAAIPVDIVEPTKVKKFFTGKGNSDKAKMYEAFVAETGVPLHEIMTPNKSGISSPVSDIVDAYAICKWFSEQILFGG